MSNPWDEFRDRLAEHQAMEDAINRNVQTMARLVAGRLKYSGVGPRILEKLKRELANYNIQTGRWKE